MSPGLKRAREPFKYRNALTGLILASFVVGVWAYSISAVKQDDFADVDEEARALAQSRENAKGKSKEGIPSTEALEASKQAVSAGIVPVQLVPVSTIPEAKVSGVRPRGLVTAAIAERYPGIFDPSSRTLVWGAPPVDNVGKIGTRSR